MARKRFHGMYEGVDERRRQEHADSMMIKEDRSSVANLPQQVVMRDWPKVDYTGFEGLDDTIRGVDQQMNDDARGGSKKRGYNPEKF